MLFEPEIHMRWTPKNMKEFCSLTC